VPFDDPNSWAQGAAAFKGIFDGLRVAIGMLRDLGGSSGESQQQQKLVDDALDKAERATRIAEAELAKALGYELCRCEFPPTPMVTVGYWTRNQDDKHAGDPCTVPQMRVQYGKAIHVRANRKTRHQTG
jgi:hypothetical protein